MSVNRAEEKLSRPWPARLLRVGWGAAIWLLLTGCAGASSPRARSDANACRELAEQRAGSGQTLTGDVTGDGRPDRVGLVIAQNDEPRCRFRLVVRSGEDDQTLVLHQPRSHWAEDGLPRLEALSAIDERLGHEIVVAVREGAATTAVAIVTSVGGTLHRMAIEGTTGRFRNALIYGASGGGAAVLDCVGGRRAGRVSELLMSRSTKGIEWIALERRVFRATGHRLELERIESQPHVVRDDVVVLANRPFPSCTEDEARRPELRVGEVRNPTSTH